MWWCRCTYCRGAASPAVRLTNDSLRLSLATYLRLRLRAARYVRAPAPATATSLPTLQCTHSLFSAHSHYFAHGPTTVCFKYNKIRSWEINLPPATISTSYNAREMRDSLINQVNDLVLKGHEVFSSLTESESDKDHSAFKQHMDHIQLNLTSASLQNQDSDCGVVRILWSISDGLIIGEKILREASEKWSSPPTIKLSSKPPQESTGSVEIKAEQEENSPLDFSGIDCAADKGNLSIASESDHAGDEDEDKSDRKSVRAILLQLLSNSQPANQNGIILSDGLIPIVVYPGEIGSVISAALASVQYHQQLQLLMLQQAHSVPTEQDERDTLSPSTKEKAEDKEKSEKSKSSKTSDYIEVQLKDGLFCRVYHPLQFCKLRNLFLAPLSSNVNITNQFVPSKGNDVITGPENDTHHSSELDKKSDGDAQNCNSKYSSGKDKFENVKNEMTPNSKRSVGKAETGNNKAECTFPEVEEAFVRSLSRCIAWAAKGGKSGSTFCKTKDDRFVLKEMSKFELQLFLEMAPHYFSHVASCHQNGSATLLARIVGVFRVGGSAGAGGGVLVIENVFYGREGNGHSQQRFDLKGARRNRLAPDTAQPDAVLMDENLLNLCWESPLYLQWHNAEVLWSAIERDTSFLASHQVMDYSLLLGLDETNNELTIGIIDYIRTFTWDKKLEHIVKKGLGSGPPTIVSPEQYKSRFFNAMKKYFLQCPNQWDDLHNGLISKNVASS